ncbi:hypothetical protein HK405_001601, partial [Cladochytrium tenue]
IRARDENLICVGVIPGPKKPMNMDSFLYPMVEELQLLGIGVTAFDSCTQTEFTLRAHIISVFGDMPAISTLMHTKGVNALCPCRSCTIKGVRAPSGSTLYYPLRIPKLLPGQRAKRSLNPLRLPMRTEESYEQQVLEIERATNNQVQQEARKQSGINSRSILSQLPSISFPWSFGLDAMHLFFEN